MYKKDLTLNNQQLLICHNTRLLSEIWNADFLGTHFEDGHHLFCFRHRRPLNCCVKYSYSQLDLTTDILLILCASRHRVYVQVLLLDIIITILRNIYHCVQLTSTRD